jgi:hypothetical protein
LMLGHFYQNGCSGFVLCDNVSWILPYLSHNFMLGFRFSFFPDFSLYICII